MKQINKKEILKFINTKEGKKILMYVGIGILLSLLWKVVILTGIIVGVVYLIKKRKGENDR